jgi:glyoxylase-like metal-dependent hydrolase (beta-lactamase superfamily II)
VTHLHADHVGHLSAYPNATYHLAGAALDLLRGYEGGGSPQERRLVRHGIFAELLPADLAARAARVEAAPAVAIPGGLSGFDLFGDGSVLALPLPGHARGHFGVYLPTLDPPLLYAVDAAWTRAGLLEDRERSLPVRLVADDPAATRASAAALRRLLSETGAALVLCHDPEPTPYDFEGPAP